MIDLHVLSGKMAGSRVVVSHFPFNIGRTFQNDLPLEDDGVWDRHLTLEFHQKDGFHAITTANAIVTVNGKQVEKSRLHNGDIITLGSAKLQFWLAPAVQRGLSLRENVVWALLILVTVAQFFLILAFLHEISEAQEGPQCRKCRVPVNAMVMPCSSAAAITSASLTEPPGWMAALAPASAAAIKPSGKGKNASLQTTLPLSESFASCAFQTAMRLASTRLICPAPIPTVRSAAA